MKRSKKGSSEFVALLEELDAALKTYVPKRHKSIRGAKTFAPLEALTPISDDLRALWTWADNDILDELWVTSSEPSEWERGLSVKAAAATLKSLRKIATFPKGLIPIAEDGNGNALVVDEKGAVLDWDHETRKPRKIAPSLAALVRRSLKEIKSENLFGGPEVAASPKGATNDPVLKKVAALVKELPKEFYREKHLEKIVNTLYRAKPAIALEALFDPTLVEQVKLMQPHERESWVGLACERSAQLSQWDNLFKVVPLIGPGKLILWNEFGDRALKEGNKKAALQCFRLGTKIEGALGKYCRESAARLNAARKK